MNTEEIERVTVTVAALRPDWTNGLPDRYRSLRSFVTEHLAAMTFQQALLQLVACAADSATVSPGRVLTDGPWRRASRGQSEQLLSADRADQLGGRCRCGVWQSRHHGAAVQDCDEYTPDTRRAATDPTRIAELRAVALGKTDA